MSEAERDRARQEDEEECFKLKTAQAQAICFAQASERDADRVAGRTPRPLFPDRQKKRKKNKPSTRIPTLIRIFILIPDILLEPCSLNVDIPECRGRRRQKI